MRRLNKDKSERIIDCIILFTVLSSLTLGIAFYVYFLQTKSDLALIEGHEQDHILLNKNTLIMNWLM